MAAAVHYFRLCRAQHHIAIEFNSIRRPHCSFFAGHFFNYSIIIHDSVSHLTACAWCADDETCVYIGTSHWAASVRTNKRSADDKESKSNVQSSITHFMAGIYGDMNQITKWFYHHNFPNMCAWVTCSTSCWHHILTLFRLAFSKARQPDVLDLGYVSRSGFEPGPLV